MFKVATWNINSINVRKDRVLAFLKREAPDVLSLQELKTTDEKFPMDEINAAGYSAAVFGQRGYNGVAILTKKNLSNVQRGFGDNVDDPAARSLSGHVNGVDVICVYVPNGQEVGSEKYLYKLRWLRRLREFLDRAFDPKRKVLLMGDFNVIPDAKDVHDPKGWEGGILFSDLEKAGLAEVVDFGFSDLFRLHHSEPGYYSWWDYRELAFPKNHGARIDFVFGTAAMKKACQDCRMDRDERKGKQPSDHIPVIAEFKL